MKLLRNTIFLILTIPSFIIGQTPDGGNSHTTLSPSSNAKSTAKIGNTNVDLSTGAAVANIPMYNKSIAGVNLDVSLSYYSNGTKAGDIGSWVGLGWNLRAGGAITRIVKGGADNTNSTENHGFFWSRLSHPYFNGLPDNSFHPTLDDTKKFDMGQDVYRFNFLGRSGKLVFLENGEPSSQGNLDFDWGEIITVPYMDLEVDVIKSINGFIDGFTITDENGIQYVFGDDVTAIETAYSSVSGQFNNAWYLKEIKLPNNLVIFSFSYQSIANPDYDPSSQTMNMYDIPVTVVPIYTPGNIGSQSTNGVAPCPVTPPDIQFSNYRYETKNHVNLTEINFEGGSYVFETKDRAHPNNTNAYPHPQGLKILEKVHHKGVNGEILNTFYLDHKYFVPIQGTSGNRPMLDKVIQYGKEDFSFTNPNPLTTEYPTSTHPEFNNRPNNAEYVFSYYSFGNYTDIMPSPSTINVDAWGYFNDAIYQPPMSAMVRALQLIPGFGYIDRSGNYSFYGTQNNRYPSVDLEIVRIGALKTIKFPKGSSYEYSYELNEAYETNFFDHLMDGHPVASNEANRLCGGIRVKSISLTPQNTTVTTKKYFYETVDAQGELTGVSSGSLFNKHPLINRHLKTARAGDWAVQDLLCFSCNYEVIIPYLVDPLTESFDNHMIYTTVTERIESNVGQDNFDGKTIYYYEPYQQYPQFYEDPIIYEDQLSTESGGGALLLEQKVSPHIANYNFVDVSLVKKEVYKTIKLLNGSSDWVLESKNEFSYITEIDNQVALNILDSRREYLSGASLVTPCYDYNYLTGISTTATNTNPKLYDKELFTINPKISRLLDLKLETVYNDAGEPITSETKYSYNSFNQLIEERKSSSDNTYYFTKYFRVTDFGIPTLQANLDMLSKHIHAPVIEKVRYSNNNNVFDGNEKIISGAYNLFDNVEGNVLVKTKLELNTDALLSPSSISVFNDNGFDSQFYKPIEHFISYDDKGRLLEFKAENGVEIYNKFSDSPNKILIAQCQNTTPDYVFYTSFEDEKGGSSIDFNPTNKVGSLTTDSKTGSYSIDLSVSSVKQIKVKTGKYVLSFWTKELPSTTPFINLTGTAITILKQRQSPETPNQWRLNHYLIDVTALSDILIEGNLKIDEIKLYPFSSQLRTFTYYDGGIVKSITNENDLTKYYEYDLMHRLKNIKNANRNLLEERKYHTINLQDSNY